MPHHFTGRGIDPMILAACEDRERWAEVSGLAILLKDRNLARDILGHILNKPGSQEKEIELLNKISKKLNRKTRKIIDKLEKEHADESTREKAEIPKKLETSGTKPAA